MNKQARMREAFGAAGPRRLEMIAVPILGAPADPNIDLERVETALRELAGPAADMLVPGADPLDLWGPWLGTEDQRAHPAASPETTAVFQAALALALGGEAGPTPRRSRWAATSSWEASDCPSWRGTTLA